MKETRCTICTEVKPVSEFYRGNIRADGSYGLTSACKPCFQARAKARKTPEKSKEWAHRAYLKQREKHNEGSKSYHEKNREKHNAQMREYYRKNKKKEKGRVKRYNEKNPDKLYARGVRRQMSIHNATPPDEDMGRLKIVYKMAKAWGKRLGVPMQVDHVIPLCGGGLHTWDNLQVVSAKINHTKGRNVYLNGFAHINLMLINE